MQKKYLFSYFFLITYPQAHHLQYEKFNFLLKFCVKILFCRHYFNPLNTFMRKGKDPDPDTYLWQMDSDPGGLKTCGSCGSWSPTLRNLLTDLSFKTTTYKRVSGSLRNVTIGWIPVPYLERRPSYLCAPSRWQSDRRSWRSWGSRGSRSWPPSRSRCGLARPRPALRSSTPCCCAAAARPGSPGPLL